MRNQLYPYDDVITQDGYLWAINNQDNLIQAVISFNDISSRFINLIKINNLHFIMRSRLCQLGLDCKLMSFEKPFHHKNKLECVIEINYSRNNFIAERTVQYLLNCGKQIPIGKLFLKLERRKLLYESIIKNIYAIDLPLIEAQNILPGKNDNIIIPIDQTNYIYEKNNLPNEDQLHYILTAGTRQDLDFFRIQQRTSLPQNVPPNGWVLTQLPHFKLKEHFATIESLTLDGNIVKDLHHASASLFDPIGYKQVETRPMIEVFNSSDQPLKFDGVSISLYRPAKRFCSIQVPANIRLEEVLSFNSVLTENMDKFLKGSDIGEDRYLKHSAFLVDKTEIDKLDKLKNTTISNLNFYNLEDNPEFKILDEISNEYIKASGALFSYYFPRWDISSKIELCKNNINAIIFRNSSYRHNPFFSEFDIITLKRLNKLGIRVIWLKDNNVYEYFIRENCGFFLDKKIHQRFNYATFFACYGSGVKVSESIIAQLPDFFVQLKNLFGEIGFITGGGSGLMEAVNKSAFELNFLSASCCLSTEFSEIPQKMNDFTNIFMYFAEDCRHIRQKNFSIARFPIFFPGGAGTLEEIGIELCNQKLGVRDNAPFIFFNSNYWIPIKSFVKNSIKNNLLKEKILNNIFFVDDLSEAINIYKDFLLNPIRININKNEKEDK
jgi:predicted Rossmann-fold nucleotide-binding protein